MSGFDLDIGFVITWLIGSDRISFIAKVLSRVANTISNPMFWYWREREKLVWRKYCNQSSSEINSSMLSKHKLNSTTSQFNRV